MKTLGTAAVLALLLAAPAVAAANLVQIGQSEQRATTLAADENIGTSIETLLKGGWQFAGYASANQLAVESAMILLRHPNESYFVQCRASYDVTRSPASPCIATSCASSGHRHRLGLGRSRLSRHSRQVSAARHYSRASIRPHKQKAPLGTGPSLKCGDSRAPTEADAPSDALEEDLSQMQPPNTQASWNDAWLSGFLQS